MNRMLKIASSSSVRSETYEETFIGVGGINIFTQSWRPVGVARAVVVISHGFNSHSGQYVRAAEQFVEAGFAVYALDHRGRGRSGGERFHVDTFADYVSDLATFIQRAKSSEPGLPVFLLGHSAGGVVSRGEGSIPVPLPPPRSSGNRWGWRRTSGI
jgi:acylglycerol lipase